MPASFAGLAVQVAAPAGPRFAGLQVVVSPAAGPRFGGLSLVVAQPPVATSATLVIHGGRPVTAITVTPAGLEAYRRTRPGVTVVYPSDTYFPSETAYATS